MGAEVLTLERSHLCPVIGLAISPDERCAFTTIEFKSTQIYVWDIQTGKLLGHRWVRGNFSRLDAFAAAPAGDRILAAMSDWGWSSAGESRRNWILGWESAKSDELFTLKGHKKKITTIAFSGDGRFAVSGSDDHRLIVWDIIAGKRLHVLAGHAGPISGVAIPLAKQFAVSTSDDGTVRKWDLQTGAPLAVYEYRTGRMTGIAVSPHGTAAVSAAADGTLVAWDLENNEP
jgi:WD40 repeat protein